MLFISYLAAMLTIAGAQSRVLRGQDAELYALSAVATAKLEQDRLTCGPRSVYLLARLNGRAASRTIFEHYLPSSPQGMSLVEMARTCNTLGVPVSIRDIKLDELIDSRLTSPVIAYLRHSSIGGHYVVILSSSPASIRLINPTTAKAYSITREQLAPLWTGFVVLPIHGGVSPVPGALWIAAGATWLALACTCRMDRTTR
jgi:hypothetical protein